ncbi:hypothetical protein [Streptomyces virginiae]|uniref:hypothetical protein n=1 Tax=Streptomyces virginiae TaxID=1961 RepID=UPI0035DF411C
MLKRTLRKDRAEVAFILPAEIPPGPVSVVGDFNDWRPGVHTLTARRCTGSATVVQAASAALRTRSMKVRAME